MEQTLDVRHLTAEWPRIGCERHDAGGHRHWCALVDPWEPLMGGVNQAGDLDRIAAAFMRTCQSRRAACASRAVPAQRRRCPTISPPLSGRV